MATTTIDPTARLITLINVFEVGADRQDELVRLLEQATGEIMRQQPGFVSANIHKSLDGRHVANYAQWSSKADFERMLQNPEAQQHMGRAREIAKAEPILYEVVSVHR
ncbi:MAG TPA: antibiotic biosynthesis monooxygenase family protein [Polyangiales bacterium]|nr:antibiotic biosynthesis monooxygenase family protein [Polyangiales bacterium]